MSQPTPFEVDLETLEALPEAEREIELQKVAILKRNLERNPLWAYVPHEGEVERKRRVREPLDGTEDRGQVAFHELSKERIPVGAYVAGNRSGKTHAGSADNLIQILPPHFLPPWLLQYKRWGLDGEPVFVRSIGVDLGQWLEKVLLDRKSVV